MKSSSTLLFYVLWALVTASALPRAALAARRRDARAEASIRVARADPDAKPARLALLEGARVSSAVTSFLAREKDAVTLGGDELAARLRERAWATRLLPRLRVPVARTPGSPALFVVTLYQDDNVETVARAAAEQAGLAGEDVAAAVHAVRRVAQMAGLLSARLALEGADGAPATVEWSAGEDAAAAVLERAADVQVAPAALLVRAQDAGAVPLFAFEVDVPERCRTIGGCRKSKKKDKEKENVGQGLDEGAAEAEDKEDRSTWRSVWVEVYEGEELSGLAESFGTLYDLDPAQRASVREELQARAAHAGFTPALSVPILHKKDGPGELPTRRLVPLFAGDTVEDIAAAFERAFPGDAPGETLRPIAERVHSAARRVGLQPEAQVVWAGKRVALWFGEKPRVVAERALRAIAGGGGGGGGAVREGSRWEGGGGGGAVREGSRWEVDEESLEQLTGLLEAAQHATRQTERESDDGIELAETVHLPDGSDRRLVLRQGDLVDAAVSEFLAEVDLANDAEANEQLRDHIVSFAQRVRKLPLFQLGVTVRNVPVPIRLYDGDDLAAVAEDWARSFGVSETDIQALYNTLKRFLAEHAERRRAHGAQTQP